MQKFDIRTYDPFDPRHEDAFISLLIQGGKADGLTVSRDTACAITHRVGWCLGFDVFFACGHAHNAEDSFQGMLLTTEGDFAGGRFLRVEKIITDKAADKETSHFLFQNALAISWEMQKQGLVWEASDIPRFFAPRADPCVVLRFEESDLRTIITGVGLSGAARLATVEDLDDIAGTLRNYPETAVKYGHLASILLSQKKPDLNARSFIVKSEDGSFAFATGGAMVFSGQRRYDLRMYFAAKANPENVSSLMKAAAVQFGARKWRGPASVELTVGACCQESRKKTVMAEAELTRIGGKLLRRANQPMISYRLDGRHYDEAVTSSHLALK